MCDVLPGAEGFPALPISHRWCEQQQQLLHWGLPVLGRLGTGGPGQGNECLLGEQGNEVLSPCTISTTTS